MTGIQHPSSLIPVGGMLGQARIVEAPPPLAVHHDAVYVPVDPALHYDHDLAWGLFDNAGRLVPEAAWTRGASRAPVGQNGATDLRPDGVAGAPDHLYVYAGPAIRHFGHFLISGLARLWPRLRSRPEAVRFLYHGHLDPEPWFAVPYVGAALSALGLSPTDFIRFEKPVRLPEIIVPAPSFEELRLAHRAHLDTCRTIGAALLAEVPACPRPRPVYLAKTKLGLGVWRIVNEGALVAALDRAGVDIVHPETMSLAEQVRLFEDAPLILGLAGSGLHTSLLAPSPSRMIALHYDQNLPSNFRLVDRLKGNRSIYLAARPALELLPREPAFHLTFRLPDPAATAEDLLRIMETTFAGADASTERARMSDARAS